MEILSREIIYLPEVIRIIYTMQDSWGRILHDTVEIERERTNYATS
jgi:hypothetical protein